MKCLVDDCANESQAKGLCQKHYMRLRKHGSADTVSRPGLKGLTPRERFECQVVRNDGCWGWTGCKDKKGYCRIMVDGKLVLLHRFSWELHFGKINDGRQVCHHCDNPTCSNPEHLFLGTQKANMRDMWEKGRANPGKPFTVGVANASTSLSEEDVYAIREASGSKTALALFYGISRAQIWNIRSRKSWKHLHERQPMKYEGISMRMLDYYDPASDGIVLVDSSPNSGGEK